MDCTPRIIYPATRTQVQEIAAWERCSLADLFCIDIFGLDDTMLARNRTRTRRHRAKTLRPRRTRRHPRHRTTTLGERRTRALFLRSRCRPPTVWGRYGDAKPELRRGVRSS